MSDGAKERRQTVAARERDRTSERRARGSCGGDARPVCHSLSLSFLADGNGLVAMGCRRLASDRLRRSERRSGRARPAARRSSPRAPELPGCKLQQHCTALARSVVRSFCRAMRHRRPSRARRCCQRPKFDRLRPTKERQSEQASSRPRGCAARRVAAASHHICLSLVLSL
jgi:hypothetical protein